MTIFPKSILIISATFALVGAGCAPSHTDLPRQTGSMDRSIASLPAAHAQETVDLKNGQSYELSASFVHHMVDGKDIRMLAYNNQIPGPILQVAQGDSVTVNFTNNFDQPTTVHWHGLRLDNANDGVPNVTQAPIPPGGAYTYTLKFPDAGLYWYHPHVREDEQQELGLYGLIWVEPSDPTTFDPVNQTAFIALDDMLLAGNDVYPFDAERVNHALMGRFGNVLLTNGQADYTVHANKNDVVRFAAVNTANTRTFKVSIPGMNVKLVGGDNGGFKKDQWVESVLLGPSERAIIEARFTKPGTYELRHTSPVGASKLGTIIVSSTQTEHDNSASYQRLQDRSAQFAGLEPYYDKPVDKEIDLTINMNGMMDGMQMNGMMMNHGLSADGIEWEDSMAAMNEQSTDKTLTWIMRDKATSLENEKLNYTFTQGDKVKIRLFNDKTSMHPMQHVIHFHGNRFVVLAENGVKNTNPVWEDSELIPVGGVVDILLDASNPGTWMMHCHIPEHMESGMMIQYQVK